jgi:rhodanese-related sulfurtransferase
MLRRAGVTNVRALVGGYEEWVKRGDPIVKGDTCG